MRRVLVTLALAVVGLLPGRPAAAPPAGVEKEIVPKDLPAVSADKYKAGPYLAAAATLQAAGKEKAGALLVTLSGDEEHGEKAIVLARILFPAKASGPFRRPGLGAPPLLGGTNTDDWPLEPVELVDGAPFLIVLGYSLGGLAESPRTYVGACLAGCEWNSQVLKPKTAKQQGACLAKLLASRKWKRALTAEEEKFLTAQVE